MNVSYQTSEQGFFKSLTTLLEKLNLTETKTSSDTAQLAAPDNFEDSYKHTFNDDDAETQELKIINLIKACEDQEGPVQLEDTLDFLLSYIESL